MAFATIAGITVTVQTQGAGRRENVRVGTTSRAFAGNLRSGVRVEKQVYEWETGPMAAAAVATLRAAIVAGTIVAVAGDLVAAACNADVRITDERFVVDEQTGNTGFQSVLSIHVEEV